MNPRYNFAPGPAMLPQEVLQRVKDELFDWQGTGVSVMEVGHRTSDFQNMLANVEHKIRQLMSIPSTYKILFLPGGAQGQFDAVPLNLTRKNKKANYFVTGIWSERAAKYANKYAQVHLVTETLPTGMPDETLWHIPSDAAYTYYCSNETINGIRFPTLPKTNTPLVVDMTSSILAEHIGIEQFGIIFASAQKNLGIAGITLVIVREDLLEQSLEVVPEVFNYKVQAQINSCLNTIPTFPLYVMDLMLDWLIDKGGVATMEHLSQKKSEKLYQCIDNSDGFYVNKVGKKYRSLCNVPFDLPTDTLLQTFLEQADNHHLMNLKGHQLGGGARASLYNAMPEAGVEQLVDFMQDFAAQHA